MDFHPQQAEALDKIQEWHRNAKQNQDKQVFRLFGYAGTGKTTLAKEMRKFATKVQYMSLTGKAALVMQGKGCEGARTIHSMIYRSMDRSKEKRDALAARLDALKANPNADGNEVHRLTREVEEETRALMQPSFSINDHAFDRVWVDDDFSEHGGHYVYVNPPDLLVVDECSMVDKRVGLDLESFKIPILVLGDPAQLPPVSGGGHFTGTKDHPVVPDVLLTEIHRQAEGNPIIDIATACRTSGLPPCGQYGDSRVVAKWDLRQEEWLAADQILCGKNDTRHALNRRLRQLRGFSGILPCVGERVICLRNNHEMGLLNGSLWETVDILDKPETPFFLITLASLDDPDRELVKTLAHKKPFMGEDWEDPFQRREADEFDFGHVITTHKAQGSEWPNVIYIDEWPRGGEDKRRHQYTGVTRASKSITVVTGWNRPRPE